MQEPNKTQQIPEQNPYIPDKTRDFYMVPAILEDSVAAIRAAAESILDEVMPIQAGMTKARDNADIEDSMRYLYGERENPATA